MVYLKLLTSYSFLQNLFLKASFVWMLFCSSTFSFFHYSLAQAPSSGVYYQYKIKNAEESAYPDSWETSPTRVVTISGLDPSASYTVITRVCDQYGLCSDQTNNSRAFAMETVSTKVGKDIAVLVGGNGTQNIVLDFLEIFPQETSYTLYSDRDCTSVLTSFISDANARAENVNVTVPNNTDINYFWIKEDGNLSCRRVNFAYKRTDPCAGLPGGEWVWVPPLSDGIGDGLSIRAIQVGYTNPKGFCVMKYIAAPDDSVSTCASTLAPELSYLGMISSDDASCNPLASLTKYPWVMVTQSEANSACKRLGAKYRLLTNAERMTININAEMDYRNWSNQIGFDGSAKLNRGHSEGSGLFDGPRPAYDGICLREDERCTLDFATNWHENRRTFYVKNGIQDDDIIWDLVGNVWTWALWSESVPYLGSTQIGTYDGWQEWRISLANTLLMTRNSSLPQNLLNENISNGSTFNLGRYYRYAAGSSYGAPLWGADWTVYSYAGLFTLNFAFPYSHSSYNIGFVCSYQP